MSFLISSHWKYIYYMFLQAGQAVHVGGLMRIDLNEASVDTIYVTIWASPNVSLHMGKIENADEIWKKHAGIRLQVKLATFVHLDVFFFLYRIYIKKLNRCILAIFDLFDNILILKLNFLTGNLKLCDPLFDNLK